MRLLLLLLSACVLTIATSEEVSNGRIQRGVGIPTAQKRRLLEQARTPFRTARRRRQTPDALDETACGDACQKAYEDVVADEEQNYFCGHFCQKCLETSDGCTDSQFCQDLLKNSGGTCDTLTQYLKNDANLVEFYCSKSCTRKCGAEPTTTTITTTTAANATACSEIDYCAEGYADIVDGEEKDYFCGKTCQNCVWNQEECVDSQFCAKVMKESGGSCDTLFTYLKDDVDLRDFYCFKSCSRWC